MRQVLKTIRGIDFLSNAPNPALANPQAQFIQLLGHARPAVAANAQAVLIAVMRQQHHIAPLSVRRWSMLPSPEAPLRHANQAAQVATGQVAAILSNILKLQAFSAAKTIAAFF